MQILGCKKWAKNEKNSVRPLPTAPRGCEPEPWGRLPLTSGAIPFCVAQETSLAWETLVKWPWSIFCHIFANSEIDQKIDFTLKPRLGACFWSFEISDAKSGSFWDPKWIPVDDFFVVFQKTVTSLIQH